MTSNSQSRVRAILAFALAGFALAVPACVNNDPVDEPEGDGDGDGDAATGGMAGDGDGDTATGGTGDGDSAESCGNGDNNDAHVPEMLGTVCETSNIPNCNITDFTATSFDAGAGTWGDEMSLTGGSFDYKDTDSTVTWDVSGDQLNITASVSGGGYIGVGLWFGPCTDATDFEGIQITLSGNLDEGGIFDLQVNSDENYPVEERDNFGSCEHADGEEWNECTNNFFRFPYVVEGMATTFRIPWSEFTGGKPVATLSANQLGGLQLQAGCDEATAPCDISLQVYDVRFYRDADPFLGETGMGGAGN